MEYAPLQVTGVGYNDVGDVICRGTKVTGVSHPSLLKLVEVRIGGWLIV